MTNPIDHSVVSIRIVLAFLEFLSSVQSSIESVDNQEKLRNVKESLVALFNISPSILEANVPKANVLMHGDEQSGSTSTSAHTQPSFSTGSTIQLKGSLSFLFQYFHLIVETLGLFNLSLGQDYLSPKSRAKQVFKDAITVLTEAGHVTFDHTNLAHGLKILGNNAMHSEMYNRAIEMYSIAIAMSKDNAIYFCNRAAAFTKVGKYEEAIGDCYEAIKLNPQYVVAYYRLGCAYYEQGKNLDAIREGFLKVLELEPNNEDAIVCLQLADSKVGDEVASLREQIGNLRMDGGFSNTVTGKGASSPRQSTVLVFRGPEEGGNGPWELVEDMGDTNNDEDTISVAEFIDTHVRNIPPPE